MTSVLTHVCFSSSCHPLSRPAATAVFGLAIAIFSTSVDAGSRQVFCVTCTEPDMTYRCEVEEPTSAQNAGPEAVPALSLFCVRRIAQDGGHASCGVSRGEGNAAATCAGTLRSYAYEASGEGTIEPPIAPPAAKPPRKTAATPPAAPVAKAEPTAPAAASPMTPASQASSPAPPAQAPAGATTANPETIIPAPSAPPNQPRTVIEATGRAIETSKDTIVKAGETVTDGAKSVGTGVKSVFQKTGDAIGSAASTTWRCVSSLFAKC